MTKTEVSKILRSYKRGLLSLDDVIKVLSATTFESFDIATLDHHRELRQGFPEVVLCQGKTKKEVAEIAKRITAHGSILLATRATPEKFRAVKRVIPKARYNEVARTITANEHLVSSTGRGIVLVITAGTADRPIAEEAVETARIMGNDVDRIVDVGVAGIHRILRHNEKLRNASVIIVVAGMDGALPSVVGGLVDVPVIAVPTSVGYGASFGGIAALLTMLNSCAAGVTVVNIDNGFGAGYAASTINRR